MKTQEKKIDLATVAEITLSYNSIVKASQRPKVCTARQVYEVLYNSWDKGSLGFVEHFKVMLLSRANRVLGLTLISSGGTAGTVVDVKLVFAAAIKANASSIILSHNHPSGNLMPSEQDKRLTQRMVEAGRLLDIPVIEHIIITEEGYFSFADEGIL
jgi:DNA repair protein RadC